MGDRRGTWVAGAPVMGGAEVHALGVVRFVSSLRSSLSVRQLRSSHEAASR